MIQRDKWTALAVHRTRDYAAITDNRSTGLGMTPVQMLFAVFFSSVRFEVADCAHPNHVHVRIFFLCNLGIPREGLFVSSRIEAYGEWKKVEKGHEAYRYLTH